MAKKNLTGKKIVITGGARGIGRATAEAFIAAGARVVIGDVDEALVQKTAAEVTETTGGSAVGLGVDVTQSTAFAAFLDAADQELGGIDVVVNNAGIMPTGPFLDESEAVSDRQIDINLRGVITGTKLAAARFATRGDGHVVNVASLAGIVPSPGVAVYCATKAAVVALGDALSQELTPQGVRITTIAPSLVRTELISGITIPRAASKVATVNPEDIAGAIVGAVASKDTGLVIVPGFFGGLMRTTTVLPERIRNALYKAAGLDANMHNDESARQDYLDRITGSK